MKLLFRSLFALLALTFSVNLYAQDVITGTVLDDRGEPVIGGGVVYVGTDIGVVTDIDGHFSIKRLPGKTLQFSSIGMQTMEIVSTWTWQSKGFSDQRKSMSGWWQKIN